MQQNKTQLACESVCVATEVGRESFSLHKVTNMILQKEREQECVPLWVETERHMPEQDQIAGQSHLEFIGYTHSFFSERKNTAHKIMSLKGFSWTATKPQTKGPAATNPHWPAELPWCSLMLSCPGPVLFSQRIHTRPVMNIQEFSPLQDYPLFL